MLYMMAYLLSLLAFTSLACAQTFISPPATGAIHDYSEDPIYTVGDRLDIQWDVSWPTVSLWLWQNDNPNAENLLNQVKNTGKLSWQIKTNKDYSAQSGTNGTVFFFQVVGSGQQVGSHYFNLTGPPPSSSTSSSATSSPSAVDQAATVTGSGSDPTITPVTTDFQVTAGTAATATASASSGHDAAAASASQSANSAPMTSSGSSNTGLAAGLGVAFGLVFAALIGAIIYIFMRRRRIQRQQLAQQHEGTAQSQVPPGSAASMMKAPVAPPMYMGAGGYYSSPAQKGPLSQAPAEIMGGGPGYGYGDAAVSRTGSQSMRVHEMSGANTVGAYGNGGHVGGVHEMPVGHARGGSTGIYSEEGG